MPQVIYSKGAFLVIERQLSDGSKVQDVHVHVDGYPSSMELYQALSLSDACERCDKLADALS